MVTAPSGEGGDLQGDGAEPRHDSPPSEGTTSRPRGRAARRAAVSGRSNPAPGTQPSETPGGELERRVARLEFAEGAFVRLRVPVLAEGAEDGRDVLTDIDVLSIDVDQRLRVSRGSLECKGGKGQSGEPYTIVWLAGFRQLLRLDRAVLVRQTVSRRGKILARKLGILTVDSQTLKAREPGHAWLPDRFAHLDGAECLAAESRTDTQLKGLPDVPGSLVGFLRAEAMLAEPHALLSALQALSRAVTRQGVLPHPTSQVLAGHALVALILAGLQDAGRLDVVPVDVLRGRLERALTVGDPDDVHLLAVLDKADALFGYYQERIHRAYVAAGAEPLRVDVASLRNVIASPPPFLDDYVDFVVRLRANPAVARDLLQTAELACFDALLGATAWTAPAFQHLFTPEHRGLLLVALKCLGAIAGDQVSEALNGVRELPFNGTQASAPDRQQAGSAGGGQPRERNEASNPADEAAQEAAQLELSVPNASTGEAEPPSSRDPLSATPNEF